MSRSHWFAVAQISYLGFCCFLSRRCVTQNWPYSVLQVTTIKQGRNVWAWDLMLFMCSIYLLKNIRYTWIHKLFWEEFLITKQTLSTKIHVLSIIINKRPKSNHIVMLAFWHPIMQKLSNDSATTQKKKKKVMILHVYTSYKLKYYS